LEKRRGRRTVANPMRTPQGDEDSTRNERSY
jgi:hypothetical protein